MNLFGKRLGSFTADDLKQLVVEHVVEGTQLDYKREPWGKTDRDKRELLADVSSFGNTSGGALLVGVEEEDGAAVKIAGIPRSGIDGLVSRLDTTIRHGLAPRLPGVEFHEIAVNDARLVLIVEIPKSWVGPHQLIYGGSRRFWFRGPKGKYEPDIGELRTSFLAGGETERQLRFHRAERLGMIRSTDAPVAMGADAKLVVHLIPLTALHEEARIDIRPVCGGSLPLLSGGGGGNLRYNLDGYLFYSFHSGRDAHSYAQLFRDGRVELVDRSWVAATDEPTANWSGEISGKGLWREMPKCIDAWLALLQKLDVAAPIALLVSAIGVQDYIVRWDRPWPDEKTIDRDDVLVPGVLIDDLEADAETILRPVFEDLGRAGGHESFPPA